MITYRSCKVQEAVSSQGLPKLSVASLSTKFNPKLENAQYVFVI